MHRGVILSAAALLIASACTAPVRSTTKKKDGQGFSPADDVPEPVDSDVALDVVEDLGTVDSGDSDVELPDPSDEGRSQETTTGEDVPDLTDCETDADCPLEAPTCAPQGVCILCYPGTHKCAGTQSLICSQFGESWDLVADCADEGAICDPVGGKCLSGCNAVAGQIGKTNAGCDFYAIDLHNAFDTSSGTVFDAQDAQFAIIASNTSATGEAEVKVTDPAGVEVVKSIPPSSIETFLLPPDFGLDGTGVTKNAYHVESTLPVTVYQFNPLSNVGVFSNDASVLLPVSGLGKEYYAVTLANANLAFPGTVTIASVSDEPATVKVTVTAPTTAGGDLPALITDQSYQFELGPHEVANLESTKMNSDLTGTHVVSDVPVAVFSGSVATITSFECCADHLEQQMVPVTAWGSQYVIGRSVERGKEVDYFRVVAANGLTQVTIDPPVAGPFSLGKGEWVQFTADEHIRITANQPVMVAQFLAASFEASMSGTPCPCPDGYDCTFNVCTPKACTTDAECGKGHGCHKSEFDSTCLPVGDPALILAVPAEQWQKSYAFLTPDSYKEDYVNIVAPIGAAVELDGVAIAAGDFEPMPGGSYHVHRTEVADGAHTVQSDKAVYISVYGYDLAVSYGYPGGVGLQTLDAPGP